MTGVMAEMARGGQITGKSNGLLGWRFQKKQQKKTSGTACKAMWANDGNKKMIK